MASGLSEPDAGADQLILVVAPSHPWAHRQPRGMTLRELARTARAAREGFRLSTGPYVGARQAGTGPAPRSPSSPPNALVASALTGWAPAVLSNLAVAAELASGILVKVDVTGLHLRRRLRAAWRHDLPLAALAAELVDLAAYQHERRHRDRRRSPPAS